ncbi:MAG: glycosyltransferase [bacterium]|nr:glycosyltransferase [bacterium]
MARTLGRTGPVRVAIADDSGLIFSDDYRHGWKSGFEGAGCEVKVFDISVLRKIGVTHSPYKSVMMPGTAKGMAKNIVSFKPDLVWCHHGRAASKGEFLQTLHREGIKTATYLCDEPYEVGETAGYSPRFKYAFSMDACTVEVHRKSRPDRRGVFYLPPGVDTSFFARRDYRNRKTPVFFLGNATLPPRLHWLKQIERLVDGADIRFFKPAGKSDPRWVDAKDHPKFYGDCVVGLNVHRDPSITMECFKRRVVGRNSRTPVPKGLQLCRKMPASPGTGFWNDGNLPASHVNPRFFELAACGTLVVSDDHRSELARMFPMAPRASDPDHFVELVLYYLKHQDEAEKIGQACSYLISRRHSYVHRAAEVLIRVGLKASGAGDQLSFLGEQEDWLTPQDCEQLTGRSSSDPTGRFARWSPQYGMSLISTSGSPSESDSLDVPTPWLS